MLLKDKWYYRTVDLLQRKGFDMGDRTIRGRIYSFNRRGVRVDILSGNTLRVVKPNGKTFVHRNLLIADVVTIIGAACVAGDCPD
jgi:hypothetical protein